MSLSTCFFFSSRGRKVTAFGVLFNFKGNDKNTTVQNVEDMVKESWVCHCLIYSWLFVIELFKQFLDAIKEEPDFFLLVGWAYLNTENKNSCWLFSKGICQLPVTTVSFLLRFHRKRNFFDITPLLRAVCFQRHSCRPSQYAHPHIWRPHSHSWLPQVFFSKHVTISVNRILQY